MAPNPWSYTSGTSDVPLLGLTIGDMFDETAARFPDNEALVSRHQGLRYTYRQLQVEVDRCARALMALGVDKGQRVGIWAPNCAEWAITQFATRKLGAILVNINPSYRLNEVQYALRQSGCAWLVTAPHFKTSDYTAMIHELAPELASSQPGALEAARFPDLRGVVRLGAEPAPGMLGWSALLAMAERVGADELARRQRQQEFDDPINIQFTSGTTGYPKGATLSHHNILNNGFFTTELLRFTDRDRLLIPVPLYHCFGMVMGNLGCVTHGATMIYPSDGFDPTAVLEAAQAERRHRALRRADHVHRRAEPSRLRALRPLDAAHRHHGRLAVPGGGDEAGAGADAHARRGHRLRHDGDEPGEHPDAHRRAAGQAGRHGRPGAPARADQDRRPADRPGGAGRRARRAVHARLQRDARLLGQRRGHPGGDRRAPAGCTPATWPRWTRRATSTSSAASRT